VTTHRSLSCLKAKRTQMVLMG